MSRKILMTLTIAVALICLVSCGGSDLNRTDAVAYITWEDEPDTTAVLELCGLPTVDTKVEFFHISGADKERNDNGEIDTSNKDVQIEARIQQAAAHAKESCSTIILQIGSRYNDAIDSVLSENEDITVYVLSTDGSEVIAYQEGSGGSSSSSDNSIDFSSFNIEGKWKNVGAYTLGQVQEGAIVIFDGEHCNVVSPADTYAFYEEDGIYRLDCTTVGFADTLSFTVEIIDNDNIRIYQGEDYLEMKRVS